MATDAYERVIFHGKVLDRATVAALKEAEEHLGYELTILQGVGGAVASAGTHLGLNGEGGRAVDLTRDDAERKVPVLKRIGFAVWERDDLPGVWSEHIHAVLMLNSFDNARGIAPSAFRQIGAYLKILDGLAAGGPDPHPWRPDPVPVFTYPPAKTPVAPPSTNVSKSRRRIEVAMHSLGHAATLLDDADESRVVARAERDDLRELRRTARAILERMPER